MNQSGNNSPSKASNPTMQDLINNKQEEIYQKNDFKKDNNKTDQ